ncbi:MAG TPA: cupredoxin family copper-binding protein [Gemmatimonadaceae bacterium]|nr:cupredoxin family copper-binding protein [Gemmatimonadaceae bacterium]
MHNQHVGRGAWCGAWCGARLAAAVTLLLGATPPLSAQRLIDYTPNTRPAWSMDRWQPAMILAHRFELVEGGDELISIPTMTFGLGLSSRVALGFDFTSNSEVTAASLGGNETQWWAALRGLSTDRASLSGLLAYNTAARSADGALTLRAHASVVSLIAEARAFSDAFGTGQAGVAGATGLVVHLTPYLALSGDVARAIKPDTLGTAWSGGLAFAFPGTRHHFSFHATNTGAVTLQGTSRKKAYGPRPTRYGFAFIAPLGTGSQWARIFRRGEPAQTAMIADTGTVRIDIKNLAFAPGTVRIRVGQTVEWVNGDPLAHTATADDKSWGSGFINQGGKFAHRFSAVGGFPYHCEPHRQMRGIIIVEN